MSYRDEVYNQENIIDKLVEILQMNVTKYAYENKKLKCRLGILGSESVDELSPEESKLLEMQDSFSNTCDELNEIIQSLEEEQRILCKFQNIHFLYTPTPLKIGDVPDIRFELMIFQENDGEDILLTYPILIFMRDKKFYLKMTPDEEIPIINGKCGRIIITRPTPELWKAYINPK